MFDTIHFTGTVESLLYFFRNKQNAVFLAKFIQFFHEDRMCGDQTAITLNRFDDHCCHVVCRQISVKSTLHFFQTFFFTYIIWCVRPEEGERIDFRQERSHFLSHTGCNSCHGRRTIGIAMITIDECDDFGASGKCSGEFYSCVIAVRTTVTKEDFCFYTARICADKAFRIFNGRNIICISNGIL